MQGSPVSFWVLCLAVLVGIILNLVADQVVPAGFWRSAAKALSFVLAASPALYNVWVGQRREQERLAEATAHEIRDKLKLAIERLFEGEHLSKVRANVMMPDGDRLTIRYDWNMDVAPDRDVSFRSGEGVAGLAWEYSQSKPPAHRWRPVTAPDLAKTAPKSWGIDDMRTLEATKHLKWVVSIPILGRKKRTALGVLNFDGSAALSHPELLQSNDFFELCAGWAEVIGILLDKMGARAGSGR